MKGKEMPTTEPEAVRLDEAFTRVAKDLACLDDWQRARLLRAIVALWDATEIANEKARHGIMELLFLSETPKE